MRIPFASERLKNRPRPFGRRVLLRARGAVSGAGRSMVRMAWRKPPSKGMQQPSTALQIGASVQIHPRADVIREKMHFIWLRTDAARERAAPGREPARSTLAGTGGALEQAGRHALHVLGRELRVVTYFSQMWRHGPGHSAVRAGAQFSSGPGKGGGGPAEIEVRPSHPAAGRGYFSGRWDAELRVPDVMARRSLGARSATMLRATARRQNGAAVEAFIGRFPADGTGPRNRASGTSPPRQRQEGQPRRHLTPAPIEAVVPQIPTARRKATTHREPAPAQLEFRTPPTAPADIRVAEGGVVQRTDMSSRAGRPQPDRLRPMPETQPSLDRAAIDRLADDVIQRIERRGRIERERRGL